MLAPEYKKCLELLEEAYSGEYVEIVLSTDRTNLKVGTVGITVPSSEMIIRSGSYSATHAFRLVAHLYDRATINRWNPPDLEEQTDVDTISQRSS